jgi:hypothetical protein
MWGKRKPCTQLVGMQAVAQLWKKMWKLLKNLNIDLPYDPAIPLLVIYPKECDTGYSKGICTPMFIADLFSIAMFWKQPKCPTTDKWIKKMWYLYSVEFYSNMRKNEILSFASKWMEMENIILSAVSQTQKTKNRMFSLICSLQIEGKYSNVVGLGLHDKGRTYMGGTGLDRKSKT